MERGERHQGRSRGLGQGRKRSLGRGRRCSPGRGRGSGRGRGRGPGRGRCSGRRRGSRGDGGSSLHPAVEPLNWQATNEESDIPPTPFPFLETTGPTLQLPPNPQPIDFFSQLLDGPVIQLLVDETNRWIIWHT